MLEALRGYGIKLVVITNRDRQLLEHEIKVIHMTGWTHLFDTTVCGDDVEHRKPSPDLLLTAAEWLGIEPGPHCWYVGDSTTDTIAANDAGFTNIFYNGANWDDNWLMKIFPRTTNHPHQPDCIVHSFSEFRRLVETCLKVKFSL
jgi:phosphoglycolate phosphatase